MCDLKSEGGRRCLNNAKGSTNSFRETRPATQSAYRARIRRDFVAGNIDNALFDELKTKDVAQLQDEVARHDAGENIPLTEAHFYAFTHARTPVKDDPRQRVAVKLSGAEVRQIEAAFGTAHMTAEEATDIYRKPLLEDAVFRQLDAGGNTAPLSTLYNRWKIERAALMGAHNKPGRLTAGSSGATRGSNFDLSLTASENEQLRSRADAEGVSLARFIICQLLSKDPRGLETSFSEKTAERHFGIAA